MRNYLLDTNVISETRKVQADLRVMAFLEAIDNEGLFLSVLTIGELRKGVEIKRKSDSVTADRLNIWVDGLEADFADRILSIDVSVSRLWGELSAAQSRPVVDTLIAATAIVHGLTLVTRNTRDIEWTGVQFTNPWDP
jgi:predicted nucleic acid-binding protein